MTKATAVGCSQKGIANAEKKARSHRWLEGSIRSTSTPVARRGRALELELRNGISSPAVILPVTLLPQRWRCRIAACPSIEYCQHRSDSSGDR